jgi:site-specific DNA recombinase
VKRKGKLVENEDDTVIIEGNHPAIIDPEIFERANQLRGRKKERSGVEQRSNDWNSKENMSILDGLIYCGCETCGRKSTIKWYAAKGRHYIIKCSKFNASGKTCNNGGIAVKDIEHLVFEEVLKEQKKIDDRRQQIKSNDFQEVLNEVLEEQKLLEDQKKTLENQYRAIWMQEQQYLMKESKDDFEGQMIQDSKSMNEKQRQLIQTKLEAIQAKLAATPSIEQTTKKLDARYNIIEELLSKQNLEEHQINALLKEIILKVTYTRILPDDYRKLTNAEKDKYPAKIKVEFIK